MSAERWRRIEELFHEAADLAPIPRAEFLSRVCVGDDELRRQVESLLDNDKSKDDVLEAAVAEAVDQLPDDLLGQQIGPYVVTELLGAGGMGEVYRARDTKLERSVAIKVLPAALAQDPERLARFEREAKVLAALNHPNIAQIYGIEDRALVIELVDGQTLQGPLPIETALNYAKQIADALEAAHEKGIIHRDLKPANIMVTPEGVVKVLDFGLAAVAQSSDPSKPANSPTLTISPTRAGMILGTAAYMSPEQAAGKPVDKRADIWSFGVVLWEMLTGKGLFGGETISHTLAAVLTKEPDLRQVPVKTRRLLQSCLEKNPRRRLRDIGDVGLLLEEGEPPTTAPSRSLLGSMGWIAIASVAIVAAGVAGWGWWRATRPRERPLVRLNVDWGADISLPSPTAAGSSVALSPDGMRLVFVARVSGGQPRLFTRKLDQPQATELPGTEQAVAPFFSPDGQWIGFSVGRETSKISVEGGAVVPLAGDVEAPASSWAEDGIIVGHLGRGLVRIPFGGGAPTPLTQLTGGELLHAYPEILPGGKAVMFVSYQGAGPDAATIEAVSLMDHRQKILMPGGASPHYAPNGYLIYVQKGTLFAVAFDPDKLETHGNAVPILDDVGLSPSGSGEFDISGAPSGSGTLVYRSGRALGGTGMLTIQWLNAAGKKEPLLAKPGFYATPRLSPNGKRLALQVTEVAGENLWVYDPQRDAMTRLTFGGGAYLEPIWSPDGRYVVFGSLTKGIFWTRADGAGQPQTLTQSKGYQVPWSFTPDGKWLAYYELAGGGQIWTVPVEDQDGQLKAGKPEQFLKNQFNDIGSAFSPDRHWLAYTSNESGKDEVYVRVFPQPASGQGGKWQISNSGGTQPAWSRSGRELFYRVGDQIMAANYTVNGDTFVAEKPRVWIAKLGGVEWDLAPNGKRVAVLTPADTTEAPKQEHEVVLLLNFFDELRRRVTTGK
jgi:Tol biopolymer transport system component